LLAAAGAVDDWSAESEMRVVDRFGTPGGDCLQPLGVEIGPACLTVPIADMTFSWPRSIGEAPRARIATPFQLFCPCHTAP
jgi:hypothetical protein